MGFLDKLKSMAKNASERISASKEQNAKATSVQALVAYGSINGGNLQETASYSLTENCIVIFGKDKNGKSKFLAEYLIENVVDFKLLNSEQEDSGSVGIYNKHDFELTLNTGEKFEICHIYFIKETDNEFTKISQMKKIINMRDVILAFVAVISDKTTKEWVNSFYTADNLLPIFDNNGEISTNNISSNTETIRNRKLI